MITTFTHFINENLNDKEVRIMSWLYMFYVYDNNDGMKEKSWENDNRMGVTWSESVKYLNENRFIEFVNDKWKITKKGTDKLFTYFRVPKTRDEWLNLDDSWLEKYNTKQYTISSIPNDLFDRKFAEDSEVDIKYLLPSSEYYTIIDWWKRYQRGTKGWWVKMNRYLGLRGDLMPDVDSLILYRGINIKNYDFCKLKNEVKKVTDIKVGDKILCSKTSWTLLPRVAKSFAQGKKGIGDHRKMMDNEIGVIIKNVFSADEILLDGHWVDNHKYLREASIFPSEFEVIVKPRNRYLEVVDVFNNSLNDNQKSV